MRKSLTHIPMVAALLLVGGVASAAPLGTAFTYQGKLSQEDVPVDESADFLFTLWDAAGAGAPPVGGVQIGPQIPMNDVTIANGLFSVQLDFGSGTINTDARWLQIEVRTGEDPFTTLSPRQALTAAPAASFALESAQWRNGIGSTITNANEGNVGIGTGTPAYRLHVVSEGSRAIYGHSTPTGGILHGVHGRADGIGGRGVYGETTSTTGTNYGVFGISASTTGRGVYGLSTASSGNTLGVTGQSDSTSGIGVRAAAQANSGTNYGLFSSTLSPDGFAGYFTGPVGSRSYFEQNVGIGTTTPGTKLDVAGPIRSSGAAGGIFQVPNPNNQNASFTLSWLNDVARIRVGGSGVGANGGFDIQRIGDTSLMRLLDNGNIGMGTLTPSRRLHLAGSNASLLLEGSSGSSSFLRFVRAGMDANDDQNYIALSSSNGSLVTRVAGADRLRILQNGNVGINNNNPASTLHVTGSIRTDTGPPGTTNSTLEGNRLSSSGTFTVDGGLDLVLDSNRHTFVESGDDVFIRAGRNFEAEIPLDGVINADRDLDITASSILDLRGTSQLRLSSNGPLQINTSGLTANGSRLGINNSSPIATLQVDGASAEDALRVRVNGTTRFLISDTGGISGGAVVGGNTDPQYQLHIAGAGTAGKPGGGLWAATSDRRLKKNVEAMEGALEQLLALNGVTFEYIDPESINEEPGKHMGLIAQEVEEVFPAWVHEAPDGYKRVSETGTTALFVEALRELRAEKDAEIARLRNERDAEIAEMRSRLERLEQALNLAPASLP